MKPLYRKILYIILWYLIFPNIWILLLAPELFLKSENVLYLFVLLLSYVIGIIDTVIRPFSESIKEDATINPLYSLIILVLFLLNPLFIILAFYESKLLVAQYFPFWNNIFISFIGILIFLISGFIVILARYQLKQFGSGILTIEDSHQLITTGIFKYIRHPIYTGGVLGIIGFYCAFQSVVVLIAASIIYFVILRHRLIFEEKILIDEFGDQYREYMKRTKRLIPYLY